MSTLQITPLSPELERQLLKFFEEIDRDEYKLDFHPHPFSAEYAKKISGHTGRDLYFAVLKDSADMVGYGMLRGWDEGYEIPSIGLCILKQFQGMGIGNLLLNFLEAVARFNECKKVMLKVRKGNNVARTLYERREYALTAYNDEFLIGIKNLTTEPGNDSRA